MKQILAWIGIILLAGLYISTLVFALIGSETADRLFRASIAGTILVPVFLYAMILIAKVLGNRQQEDAKEEEES